MSRGTKLTSQLLAFGRRQSLAPKVVNLGRLIRGMDDMLRRALGETIDVETITSGGLWNTFVDQMQVETALLISPSMPAMPCKGAVNSLSKPAMLPWTTNMPRDMWM